MSFSINSVNLLAHAYIHNEPVFIEVPRDIVFSKTQVIDFPSQKKELLIERTSLNGAELIAKEILKKLQKSKKPLLYVGGLAKLNSPLLNTLISFCKKYKIPYVSSMVAKSHLREDHPLSLTYYNGIFSPQKSRSYIEKEVDYILEVATSIIRLDVDVAFNTGTHHIHNFSNKTILKGTAPHNKDIKKVFEILLKKDLAPFDIDLKKKPSHLLKNDEIVDFHNISKLLNQLQEEQNNTHFYFPEVGNSLFTSFGLHTKTSDLGR